ERALSVVGNIPSTQLAVLGDSRVGFRGASPASPKTSSFDCVITSPPYATALPYIDTQRLSLAFLGLSKASEIRILERSLIGNREISIRERLEEEGRLCQADQSWLPQEILKLCRDARSLVEIGRAHV